MMANYVVQRKATQEMSQENIELLTKWLAEWWLDLGLSHPTIRLDDVYQFFNGPPFIESDSFIGVLDGKSIGNVTAAKYGDSANGVQHISLYIVEKAQRGMGYGLKIWNAMWESLDKNCNICLDAVTSMVPQYERMGLQPEWISRKYVLPTSAIIQKYKIVVNLRNVLVKPLEEVSLEKVLMYDTLICGISRRTILEKWATLAISHAWVATNESGDILGYIVMRQGVDKEDMLVGPFLSDSIQIAQMLLYAVAEATESAERLRLCVPVCESENPNAIHMIENDIGIKCVGEMVRMYSKKPKVHLNKMFAMFSPPFA